MMRTNIEIEEAIQLIISHTPHPAAEQVAAKDAHGRVLAEDVTAPIDQPPWPRSPLDGYAFHAADSRGASKVSPVTLEVVDTVYAGGVCRISVPRGKAVRIMTGAPIPADCDCVLRQEDTDFGVEQVQIYQELQPYDNYCYAGEDFRRGDVILRKGTRLAGNAMGILASAGMLRDDVQLPVFRQVRCALFCTGDELVGCNVRPLPPGKIYSSNAALLAARLAELGIEITACEEAFGDSTAQLAAAIRKVSEKADLILTSGAVSVGAKDILHETLDLLGAQKVFWKVRLKPGSPLIFSLAAFPSAGAVPILSLSGNPFAASATFELFARPLLAGMAGCDDLQPVITEGILDTPFPKGGRMRRFVRGVFCNGHVTLPQGHASGQLASAAGTNCLAEIPADGAPVPAGARLKVWLL